MAAWLVLKPSGHVALHSMEGSSWIRDGCHAFAVDGASAVWCVVCQTAHALAVGRAIGPVIHIVGTYITIYDMGFSH